MPEGFHQDYSIVKYWADWCRPCKAFKPAFEDLAKKFATEHMKFFTCDIEENQTWVDKKLKLATIPSIIVFRGGIEIIRYSGGMMDTKVLEMAFQDIASGTTF